MKIHCPSCNAAIPAADIHLETAMAKCRQCDAVFSFAREPDTVPFTGQQNEKWLKIKDRPVEGEMAR